MLNIATSVKNQLTSESFFDNMLSTQLVSEPLPKNITSFVVNVNAQIGFIFTFEEGGKPGYFILKGWYGSQATHALAIPFEVANWSACLTVIRDYVSYMLIPKEETDERQRLNNLWNRQNPK